MIATRFVTALFGGSAISLAAFLAGVYLRDGMPAGFLPETARFLSSPQVWDIGALFALLSAMGLAIAALLPASAAPPARGAVGGLLAAIGYGLWVAASAAVGPGAAPASVALGEVALLAGALTLGGAWAWWHVHR